MTTPIGDVLIRRMTAADLDQVISIASSLPEAPHWPPSAYANALSPHAIPRRIALAIVPAAARSQSGDVLGFSVASLLPPQAELESIAVAADSQRRGLGRQLFHVLTAELRAAGIRDLLLEVRASNRAALAFYHSLGFVQTGLRSRYYVDPVDDAVLMSLPLA